jgi:hypothetical protein
VLVAIDRASNYVTLLPTANMQAATAARLIMDNIILKCGTFRYLISDRSTSWLNQLFAAFSTLPGFETHHIKTSSYRAQSNSLAELSNKNLIQHISAYANDPSQFPQYLAAISAGVNASVNVTLGVAPFYVLYGMNYRFPFETALTSNEQAVRSYDHPTLQALAQRMKIVREIVDQNVKDARTTVERIRNVGTKPHAFQEGDRVFISSELDRNHAFNAKHSKKFSGPYFILELKGNLARVAHAYTGRQLPSYINVDKLRLLRDGGRDVLYNIYLRNPVGDTNDQISIPEQRTIQSVSLPLNNGRPLTAHVNVLPLTHREATRPVLTQPHTDDTFYDQITPDSRLSPHKKDDACEPLHSRDNGAIITQPSTALKVSAAPRPNLQITADMPPKFQRQLTEDDNARLERIITTDPPRSSGSHAMIDPIIYQRDHHSTHSSNSLTVARPDSYAAMHINEAPASCAACIPRETDFRLTDHAHRCHTSCARQCRPHATVQGPPQSITPLGTKTRLEPYNATA